MGEMGSKAEGLTRKRVNSYMLGEVEFESGP
jgi:hypothetical protein